MWEMGTGTMLMAALLLAADALPPDTWPMNQRDFNIPIRIDPARKADYRELHLYVSTDQGKTWDKTAVAAPDQAAFAYHAASDGLYWFSICVVDNSGKQDPPSPYQGAVGQKILVDTLRPELRILAAERQGEEVVVRWEAVDPNLEPGSLRLQYRASDNAAAGWTPVTITPAASGQAGFRPVGSGPITVRLEVQDAAGNAGSAQADVVGAAMAAGHVSSPPAARSDWGPIPSQGAAPVILREQPPPARTEAHGGQGNSGVAVLAHTTHSPTVSPTPSTAVQPTPLRGPLPPRRMINSNRITLDYEVARLGPSGVGSVELYVTRDEGRTWQPIGGEPTAAPPAASEVGGPTASLRRSLTVEVPEDGVYGFTMVVKSGAGLGKPPPQAGDPPQLLVEVDRTPPQAWLYPLRADGARRDALVFAWKAADRNLAVNPITLQWARQPGGPWETIGAPELPNSGQYVWQVPVNVPAQVYLRLVVRDTAGNTGVAETPQPVLVDLSEPEVRILGLGGAPR
jgi:hypothetical protein